MKKILSFMCFFCVWLVVLTGLISVNALSENDINSSSDQITVQLLSRERVDYSQIVLKVYSAEKDLTTELAPGLAIYKETLAFEVNFNSAGIAEFTKPSESFSVSIKLESLPLNFGVISHTYFFHNHKGTTKHTFQLERVERVSLEENQGSLGTVLKDKNGVVVFADTDFTKIEADSYNIDEIKNEVTITDKYIVGFSGRDYIFYDTNVHNFSSEVNRYKFLCGRNLITYDEYIKSVSDYLLRIGDTNPEKVAKTELRREIERYYKTTAQSEITVSQNTEASAVEVLLTSNNSPNNADSQSGRISDSCERDAFTIKFAKAVSYVVSVVACLIDQIFKFNFNWL